jgi:hypothetical protein
VNPEGVYEKYVFSMTDSFKPFITFSQFFINEVDDGSDTSLLAYQTGYNWSIAKSQWTMAATLYDFKNLKPFFDDADRDFEDFRGNSGENGFNILNITSFWRTTLFGKSFKLYGDYAKNTDSKDNDYAYAFGFIVGKIKNRGDWSVGYKYARIEPDAVYGRFADSSFGGSNRYGNKFSLKYKFHPKMVFAATTWITESVRGPEDDMTDVALDLIFKF